MARFALLLVATCALGAAVAFPSEGGVVKSSVWKTLESQKAANVAVILKSGVTAIYEQGRNQVFAKRGDRMTAVRRALIQHTSSTQQGLIGVLDNYGASYKTFWVTNRIIISKADEKLIHKLAAHPDVKEIREEIVLPVPKVEKSPISGNELITPKVVRGVWVVGAHELWAQNFTGEGLVTSNIDTGVRGTHRILAPNFLGQYGWFDPSGRSSAPRDDNGHGTHTMGTIAGQEGFGVAPGSKWTACMGCAGSSCYESDLLGCAQFISCPTLTDGSAPDCTKAPHVVGNSWGSTLGGQDWYDDAIQSFHTAGVIPVFSAGNAGSTCNTVGSPGDRDVIGVAATDMDDVIAYFSSRGPSVDGRQKPEISAPGVDVLSSVNFSDEAFDKYSGTSMACPHVTGAVVLLIQKDPSLEANYEGIRDVLFRGAKRTGLTGSNQNCGGVDDSTWPNYVFGWGRMDIVSSSSGQNKTAIYF